MIQQEIDISQPAVSQHLKTLKNVGLVEAERVGFHVHYQVKVEKFAEYRIDIFELLKTSGLNFQVKENCSYKDDSGKCDTINKQSD
jgi:DNA-binding transcriptional ArsR family regulator